MLSLWFWSWHRSIMWINAFPRTDVLFLSRQTLQGWRSPGFLVSRASSCSSTSSSSSSSVSPSSSSPSLDSRSSSPLPGEPQGPRDIQTTNSHSRTLTQTDRWLMRLCVCLLIFTSRCLVLEEGVLFLFEFINVWCNNAEWLLKSFLQAAKWLMFFFLFPESPAVRSIFSQHLPVKER